MNIKCIETESAISPTLRAYAERVLRATLHSLRRDLLCATVRFVVCDRVSPREGRNCQIAVDTRAARTIVVEASADNFYAALHGAVARLDSALLQERAPNQFFTTHPPRETRGSGSPLSRPHSRVFNAGGQKARVTAV
jgi:ribosome-associated translation inhibitor RaiA